MRAADTAVRLGGDEFAALLPATDEVGARRVSAALLRALDEPITIEGHVVHTAASIGVAPYPAHGDDGDALLRRADVAMYEAKRARRGLALYDSAQDERDGRRLALLADLRAAIAAITEDEKGPLALHYQPLADLHTGRVVGIDRLRHGPGLLSFTTPARGRCTARPSA